MADYDTWAWVGGVSSLIDTTMSGTNVPIESYEADVIFNDPDGDGLVKDLDGVSTPPALEGVTINGSFHQFQQFTSWGVSVKMSDGALFSLNMHVHRLDDDRLYYRLGDSAIGNVMGAGYSRNDISSISLDTLKSNFENIGVVNQNDAFPLCFCKGTRILTPRGEVPVEALKRGDRVLTKDKGALKISCIATTRYSGDILDAERMWPVLIPQNAFGPGLPSHTLGVSPQHRILLSSKPLFRMTGNKEIFVPAKKLLGHYGIHAKRPEKEVLYYHLICETHQIVISNGIYTETFLMTARSFMGLGFKIKRMIRALMPDAVNGSNWMKPARPTLRKNARVNHLIRRCQKNNLPLLQPPATPAVAAQIQAAKSGQSR